MSAKKPPAKGLVFYPASHRYKLDGEWVQGATTIIGVLDKSKALMSWAAESVALFVADQPSTVDLMNQHGGHDPLVAFLKAIPNQRRDDAAARGTKFHDFAERILLGETVEVPPEQVGMVESALAFLDDYKIEPTLVEAVVGSREHQYAGKADLFANKAIWDWKSGKRIYPSTVFQLAAYAGAEFYVDADGKEQPIPECEAAYGVHIREDGYDVYPLRFGPDVFAEFVNILETFRINKRAEGNWKIPGTGYVGVPHVREGVA
jgi:hypothetical protein